MTHHLLVSCFTRVGGWKASALGKGCWCCRKGIATRADGRRGRSTETESEFFEW